KTQRETVWPGRARHVAFGNVLPAEWLRSFTRTQPDRSRSRIFRRSGEAKFYRTRQFARDENERCKGAAGRIQDEWERSAAPPTLCALQQRKSRRRNYQRHPFTKLEHRRRYGVCLSRVREDRDAAG